MLKYAAQGDRWANDGNLSKLVTRIALKRLAHVSLHGMVGNRAAGIRRALKDTTAARRAIGPAASSLSMATPSRTEAICGSPEVCIGHRDESKRTPRLPSLSLAALAEVGGVIEKFQPCLS